MQCRMPTMMKSAYETAIRIKLVLFRVKLERFTSLAHEERPSTLPQ
jgi:hypothetical protein